MSAFKPFEVVVLRLLAKSVLSPAQIDALIIEGDFKNYEYTGGGYFLTVKHPSLPKKRVVCSHPIIVGDVGEIHCGFVLFFEDSQLLLECHKWGPVDVPEGFRDQLVQVRESDVQQSLPVEVPISRDPS